MPTNYRIGSNRKGLLRSMIDTADVANTRRIFRSAYCTAWPLGALLSILASCSTGSTNVAASGATITLKLAVTGDGAIVSDQRFLCAAEQGCPPYSSKDSVSLQASPSRSAQFDHWEHDYPSSPPNSPALSIVFTAYQPTQINVTAVFVPRVPDAGVEPPTPRLPCNGRTCGNTQTCCLRGGTFNCISDRCDLEVNELFGRCTSTRDCDRVVKGDVCCLQPARPLRGGMYTDGYFGCQARASCQRIMCESPVDCPGTGNCAAVAGYSLCQ
jgi:hypothetical protein